MIDLDLGTLAVAAVCGVLALKSMHVRDRDAVFASCEAVLDRLSTIDQQRLLEAIDAAPPRSSWRLQRLRHALRERMEAR